MQATAFGRTRSAGTCKALQQPRMSRRAPKRLLRTRPAIFGRSTASRFAVTIHESRQLSPAIETPRASDPRRRLRCDPGNRGPLLAVAFRRVLDGTCLIRIWKKRRSVSRPRRGFRRYHRHLRCSLQGRVQPRTILRRQTSVSQPVASIAGLASQNPSIVPVPPLSPLFPGPKWVYNSEARSVGQILMS